MFNFLKRKKQIATKRWLIKYEERGIGELTDCQNAEMFWESYLITPQSDDELKILQDKSVWEQCLLSFYDINTGKCAENAFCAGDYVNYCGGLTNRITMRGLY